MTRHLEEAIRKAERFLGKECGACRLPDSEASAVPDRSFVAGWQVMPKQPRSDASMFTPTASFRFLCHIFCLWTEHHFRPGLMSNPMDCCASTIAPFLNSVSPRT